MKWIDTGDIKNWSISKQRHCQQTLPELIRRLILATAESVHEIDFPSGDSISTEGWDGRLNAVSKSPFFPDGGSGWEIGTDNSPGNKAEDDYKKRIDDPLDLNPEDTTYVFVTPRPWPKRKQWQKEKTAQRNWKDVKVINLDALCLWLESAPAVALWLARQIEKVISSDIRDIESVWNEWSSATNPHLSPALIIGGRTNDLTTVQTWINGPPTVLDIQGDHPDEPLAFLFAAIDNLPEPNRTQALSRCVVVKSVNDLRQLIQAYPNYPLIIACPSECLSIASSATDLGHHVFISTDAKIAGQPHKLPRPRRDAVEKELVGAGCTQLDAERLSRDSGRSIPVLHRRMARTQSVRAPEWASVESSTHLLPVLFAGAWDESKEEDRKIIETLSGKDYDAFIGELKPYLSVDDAPIRKVGNIWKIKSPIDAWFLLSPHITQNNLQLLEKSVLAVLTKTDPKYDLPADKRWAAGIYGKSNPFSGWLRIGLVESLVLLAVYGDRSNHVASTQDFSDYLIKKIFETADTWQMWASLGDVTPLLGEAAPDTFLGAVEKALSDQPKLFEELMQDGGGDGVFGECKHSGLLWALEAIAWNPDYFSRAVHCLFDLAGIDRSNRYANRPINSLMGIFHPHTYASGEDRLAVLDALIEKNPRRAWNFTQTFIARGIISNSQHFRWRDAGQHEILKGEQMQEFGHQFLLKIGNLACHRKNLISALDKFTQLPENVKDNLLGVLDTTDISDFTKEEQAKITTDVRGLLNWINSYDKQEMARFIDPLSSLLAKFTPQDVLERLGWLVSDPWPKLPEGNEDDRDERNTQIRDAQENATREILDKASIDRIVKFGNDSRYPGLLGHLLGSIVRDDKEDEAVLDKLIEHKAHPILMEGYTRGRSQALGTQWVDDQISRLREDGNYSASLCASFHRGLADGMETWHKLEQYGEDAEKIYWKDRGQFIRTESDEEEQYAVEKLLQANRPDTALEVVAHAKGSLDTPILTRLLEELVTFRPEDNRSLNHMDAYNVGQVFKRLYAHNDLSIDRLAQLEWPFAPMFDEIRGATSTPLAVYRLVQQSPDFFVMLLSFCFKRDDGSPDPGRENVDEQVASNRAHVAYEILRSCHLIPGQQEDGSFNEQELFDWVDNVRRLCVEQDRGTVGDAYIGTLLSHSPTDNDGAWPHTSIRNLLERLKNDVIEQHVSVGLRNSRGVVSKSMDEGGAQERNLADRYKKMIETTRARWPRTAAMLRKLVQSYENDAKHEDIRNELDQMRWG